MSSTVSLMTPELVTAVSMPARGAGVCRWRSPAIGHMRRQWAHAEAVKDLKRLGRDFWRVNHGND